MLLPPVPELLEPPVPELLLPPVPELEPPRPPALPPEEPLLPPEPLLGLEVAGVQPSRASMHNREGVRREGVRVIVKTLVAHRRRSVCWNRR